MNKIKKVYICGDSFGCPDLGWDIDPWPVVLQNLLGNKYQVVNLSVSCSSNFLIRVQVDKAIRESADFVIILGTSSTREQGKVKDMPAQYNDIYDRFRKIGQQDPNKPTRDLSCYSMASLDDDICEFESNDLAVLKKYYGTIFDLELEIQKNQYIIESSLYTLREHNMPFLFDQGGFENPIFGNVRDGEYFSNFKQYKTQINQWTLASKLPNPNKLHFHIVDQKTHQDIADYYYQNIVAFFKKL
jgi:hypothetical protein